MARSLVATSIFTSLAGSRFLCLPRSVALKMSTITSNNSRNNSLLRDTFDRLRSNPKQVLLLDGGTGEELFRRGVPDDRQIWSATALVHDKYHDILQQVHASFLQAGADAISSNSYGVVPGVGFTVEEDRKKYIGMAGKIARQVVMQEETLSPKGGAAVRGLVLGSLGPLVESYRADLIKEHAEGVRDYQIACQALAPHVDAFLAETMSCVEESAQVIEAVSQLQSQSQLALPKPKTTPMLVSYALDSKGNFRNDQEITTGLRQILQICKEKDVELLAIMFNCAEPEAITLALKRIRGDAELCQQLKNNQVLLGAYANRLTPVDPNWSLADSSGPQPFRKDLDKEKYWDDYIQLWIDELGIQLVGGCCGITPEHIAYIRVQLDRRLY